MAHAIAAVLLTICAVLSAGLAYSIVKHHHRKHPGVRMSLDQRFGAWLFAAIAVVCALQVATSV